MKDDEPLQTTVHGRHAYALYLRRDLQRPVWYVRIKTRGRAGTRRRSTGCARFEDAKLKAAQIVAELEVQPAAGAGHPSDCECFSCWRLRFA